MLEYIFSVTWAYTFALSLLLWGIGKFVELPVGLYVPTVIPPSFVGTLLAVLCLLQFAVALKIESRYEEKLFRNIIWAVWYPLAFWMLSLATSLVGFTKAFLRDSKQRGLWHTADRGFR